MTNHPEPAPPACTCRPQWPALTTLIEGVIHPAMPAPAHTPASALYLAHCTRCRAAYTGPWKRLPPHPAPPEAHRASQGRTTGLLLRLVVAARLRAAV